MQDKGLRLDITTTALSLSSRKYALDIFFGRKRSSHVFAQIDLGWVLHAGVDPGAYLRSFKGRCPLVHVKDFDGANRQVDVGCGALNLEDVLRASEEVGVSGSLLRRKSMPNRL